MTVRIRQALFTLVSGSALTIAPFACATVLVPAVGHADQGSQTDQADQQRSGDEKTLSCPDGTVVDDQNHQCVDLVSGISKQLMALPPPPSLAGGGGGGLGLPGGIPSLGTVNLPDIVLPSVGLGLVPNLNVALQPQIGGLAAPAVAAAAVPAVAAALPSPQAINPLNPLGLPPPPSINPLNPLGLP
jgi:hypothetical protein